MAPEYTDMPKLSSLVPPAAQMPVSGRGTAFWYDMLGRVHHTDTYDNSYITAPAAAGYYLVELRGTNTRRIQAVMVK